MRSVYNVSNIFTSNLNPTPVKPYDKNNTDTLDTTLVLPLQQYYREENLLEVVFIRLTWNGQIQTVSIKTIQLKV